MGGAASLLSLLPAAIQTGYGMWQYGQGRELAKQPVPEYGIPDEFGQVVDLNRTSMQGDMPGESKMRQDVRQGTSDSLEASERYGQLTPNTVGQAFGREQQGMGGIGVQSAMYRTGEKDKYANSLMNLGSQELAKQEWETLMPYQQQQQTASAMMGTGTQNTYGGITSVADYFGNKKMMDLMGY